MRWHVAHALTLCGVTTAAAQKEGHNTPAMSHTDKRACHPDTWPPPKHAHYGVDVVAYIHTSSSSHHDDSAGGRLRSVPHVHACCSPEHDLGDVQMVHHSTLLVCHPAAVSQQHHSLTVTRSWSRAAHKENIWAMTRVPLWLARVGYNNLNTVSTTCSLPTSGPAIWATGFTLGYRLWAMSLIPHANLAKPPVHLY